MSRFATCSGSILHVRVDPPPPGLWHRTAPFGQLRRPEALTAGRTAKCCTCNCTRPISQTPSHGVAARSHIPWSTTACAGMSSLLKQHLTSRLTNVALLASLESLKLEIDFYTFFPTAEGNGGIHLEVGGQLVATPLPSFRSRRRRTLKMGAGRPWLRTGPFAREHPTVCSSSCQYRLD